MASRVGQLLLAMLLVAGCIRADGAIAQSAVRPFTLTEVTRLPGAYSITALPNGRMLVTTVNGTLFVVSSGGTSREEVKGVPVVAKGGHGGLMDLALHPDFEKNHLVYFTYSEETAGGLRGFVLARATLFIQGVFPSLGDVKPLFRTSPYTDSSIQYSGRIAFGPDGHLFLTSGDRNEPRLAQDPKGTLGKVLRFNDDGTPAEGNPFARKGFPPSVWSIGHRNMLGLAFDAAGNLWENEMGPKGGDELNLILPGRNYGWPLASNGDEYNGATIPDHRPGDGFEAPRLWWTPSVSPGSLMVYSGKLWPQWKGSLFAGALSGTALIRMTVSGTTARKADQWGMDMRVRDVVEAPDGAIWLVEDRTGRIYRMMPS